MTLPLDPAALALMTQMAQRTTCIVDLATPTARKFTNYPGGLTVGSILGTITPTSGGSGYSATNPPLVVLSGGGGEGGDALPIIVGGAIVGYIWISRGWKYTSAPALSLLGGSGSGAAATVALGVTYPYFDFTFSPVRESADGSSVLSATLLCANADSSTGDLVKDASNAGAPVAVQKVWRDAADAVAATELWFEGHLGKPAFAGEYVSIDCVADTGRRGESPMTEWTEVLIAHMPPDDSTKTPFMTTS